uniref:Agenet domain-containing protein n=1 Tax=Steinernema glaseri TaxID=37863 RepID=A0A1I7YXD7_9BILA
MISTELKAGSSCAQTKDVLENSSELESVSDKLQHFTMFERVRETCILERASRAKRVTIIDDITGWPEIYEPANNGINVVVDCFTGGWLYACFSSVCW